MAIFSLNHKPIGKSKHQKGTAGAHIRYIARASAEPVILTNGISQNWREAKKWMDEEEKTSRKNARIADRVMIALPIELDKSERTKLVESFLKELTGNEIPWFASIHQEGHDKNNPHAHILLRDKSILKGCRVLKTSERGSTMVLREKWTEEANKALKQAGYTERIDHRSYSEQGINKTPTKHRGYQDKKWSYRIRDENSKITRVL